MGTVPCVYTRRRLRTDHHHVGDTWNAVLLLLHGRHHDLPVPTHARLSPGLLRAHRHQSVPKVPAVFMALPVHVHAVGAPSELPDNATVGQYGRPRPLPHHGQPHISARRLPVRHDCPHLHPPPH